MYSNNSFTFFLSARWPDERQNVPFLFTTQRTAWIERALFSWNFYLFLNLLLYILSPKPANRNTQNQCMCKVKTMKIKLIWNVNFILWLFKETIRWFWSPSNALTGSRNWKLHCRVRRCKKWINVHTPRRHWSLSLSMHSFEWRFRFRHQRGFCMLWSGI